MSNILLYSGPGVSTTALAHTKRALQELCPSYDVRPTSALELALAPWQDTASLLVIPGGRDLPYVEEFSKPRRREDGDETTAQEAVRDWVESGGSFIGICAGGYFSSSFCFFEAGTDMQVVGERNALEFFPGQCKGTVYKGFVYESDAGARVVRLELSGEEAARQNDQNRLAMHYNGGGAFMNALQYRPQGVTVLAVWPRDDPEVATVERSESETYAGEAAIVHCKVSKGQAVLFGTHPEFSLLPDSRPVRLTGAPESLVADPPKTTGETHDVEMTDEGEANTTKQPEEEEQKAREAAAAEVAEKHRQELIEEDRQRRLYFGRCLQTLGLQVRLPELPSDTQSPASGTEASTQNPKPASPSSSELAAAGRLSPFILAGPANVIRDTFDLLSQPVGTGTPTKHKHLIYPDGRTPQDVAHLSDGYCLSLQDSNDLFHFYYGDSQRCSELRGLCRYARYEDVLENDDDAEVDLHQIPKYVLTVPFEPQRTGALSAMPKSSCKARHWDMTLFANELLQARRKMSEEPLDESWLLGQLVLYGERVTSTQTMLDKNVKLLERLPNGFVSFATHQISGRGRGGNSWISPLGCLQFSLLLHIPNNPPTALGSNPMQIGPKLVFVQYLTGLAIVLGIREGLGSAYQEVTRKIRMKWPNDIYAEVDENDIEGRKGTFEYMDKKWAKMGGILVNSQYMAGQWSLIVGCGVNCLNPLPTISLSALIDQYNSKHKTNLPHIEQEQLAAMIISKFELLWREFLMHGSWSDFVSRYRSIWLHSDQEVLLTTVNPPVPIRIVGITSDTGMLRGVPVDNTSITSEDEHLAWGTSLSGKDWAWDLQPDGNSFDMLKGLIKTKA
ncbi:unnamed protein product [Sympodiomycopsis kandeliae]